MERVLVIGATGYLGKYVVKELKSKGYWVRALSRRQVDLGADEIFIGEATNPESIKDIAKDIDVVISCLGITKQKDGMTYMAVDYQANVNVLIEADKSEVSKFIYVSGLGTDVLGHVKMVQAKIKFENYLKEFGIPYAILYPNGFFSDMKQYLALAQKGKGYIFGDGENKINPIHGADVAKACVESIDNNELEVIIGGPEVFTHNEIMTLAFITLGKKPKIINTPKWLVRLIIVVMKLFTSEKTYGELEFVTNVTTIDMVAPKYGTNRLEDFFKKEGK